MVPARLPTAHEQEQPATGRASGAVRVLIADDHAIVRAGVRQILSGVGGMVVGGEASDGREVMDHLRRGQWHVLLLDLSMPGKCGIELLRQIKTQYPRLPVLILSARREDQYAVRTLRAGAAGYLCKESAPQQLVTAICKVVAGERFISPALADKLVDWNYAESKAVHETLSDREYQIFELIASGKNVSAIADELCLSVKTVSAHKIKLLQKMGMRNTMALVRYALEQRLIELE